MFRATCTLLSGLQMHSKPPPLNKRNLKKRVARTTAVVDFITKWNVVPGKRNKLPKQRKENWGEDQLPKDLAKVDRNWYMKLITKDFTDSKFKGWHKPSSKKQRFGPYGNTLYPFKAWNRV